MLFKFRTTSARVKGLAFHPRRSWLLASLHNGTIQLWDYAEGTLIHSYEEHQGPVRGIDFHQQQPLFVSGGDDHKIKVWNYKFRRCLFTLDAHDDYIRTTFFHNEHPWILSASDDQSIKIWNWQSRSRVAVLTGHSHYVMCARFHPFSELILSCAADQTIRLWDVSNLISLSNSSQNDDIVNGLPDSLSKPDYSVESRDAHNGPVNWGSFHHDNNKQYCVTAGDDNDIKLWRIDSRNNFEEYDTLRGHYNNVTCVTYFNFYGKDLVLSTSEDRTLKIWDPEASKEIFSHRLDIERFWICASHPTENLIAAGHDKGLLLIKIKKERPAFVVRKDLVLFIKPSGKNWFFIVEYNLKTKKEEAFTKLNNVHPITLYHDKINCYSSNEKQVPNLLLTSIRCKTNKERSFCELYKKSSGSSCETQKISALTAIFIGPNKIAILDHSSQVYFKINGEDKKSKNPIKADEIFEAGPGRMFIKHKVANVDTISLWDIEKNCPIGSVPSNAKCIIMNATKSYVACIESKKILICDSQLRILSTIVESRKVKSAAWEPSDILIYNTPVQIKYALIDGECAAIQTLERTMYIVTVRNDAIICIDKKHEFKTIDLDQRELRFKQAVISNDRAQMFNTIRKYGRLSRVEIQFLVKRGHPGLALRFVDDHRTRFQLALKAFDIDEALKSAVILDSMHRWTELAKCAMQVGNVNAAERAYKELRQPYKLAMLYLVTNQRNKMTEARELAANLKDTSSEFIISLILKDFAYCTEMLRRSGYHNLAYLAALNHNLTDLAADILANDEVNRDQLEILNLEADANNKSATLQTCIPELGDTKFQNWPRLNSDLDTFKELLGDKFSHNSSPDLLQEIQNDGFADEFSDEDGGDWDEVEDYDDVKSCASNDHDIKEKDVVDEDEDGWHDEDETLEDLLDDYEQDAGDEEAGKKSIGTEFVCPQPGQNLAVKWIQVSDVPLHHVLAGSIGTAVNMLQKQIGLMEITNQLRNIVSDLIMQSRIPIKPMDLQPTIFAYPATGLKNQFEDDHEQLPLPSGGYSLQTLEDRLTDCYKLFSGGKFSVAIEQFRAILLSLIFVNWAKYQNDDLDEVKKGFNAIMSTCREYIISLQIWLERKNITGKSEEENKRACELAAYFSKLNLPKHRSIKLQKAFEVFWARKEFHKTRAASAIAQRLLDVLPTSDVKYEKLIRDAKRVIASFDPQIDQQLRLAFDDLNPYSICAASFTPIYSGNQLVKCPLCNATYKPTFKGTVCRVCLTCEVGKSCLGLRNKIATNSSSDFGDEIEYSDEFNM